MKKRIMIEAGIVSLIIIILWMRWDAYQDYIYMKDFEAFMRSRLSAHEHIALWSSDYGVLNISNMLKMLFCFILFSAFYYKFRAYMTLAIAKRRKH